MKNKLPSSAGRQLVPLGDHEAPASQALLITSPNITSKWLRLSVQRDLAEATLEVTIWNTNTDCASTDGSPKKMVGTMKGNTTFVVRNHQENFCLKVEDHGNHQSANINSIIQVILEGNGSEEEHEKAWLFILVGYGGFSAAFLATFFCWIRHDNGDQACCRASTTGSRRLIALDRGPLSTLAKRISDPCGDKCSRKHTSQLSWKIFLCTSTLYVIPSLQYAIQESQKFQTSGMQDYCFFNFRCLKPDRLWGYDVFMWNHLLSNAGYIVLGLLFVLIVCIKERKESGVSCVSCVSCVRDMNKGVCHSYQLFKTMGLVLAMIGVMSSCYHFCPTDVNFQFDVTYMYLLTILMAINLFKSRHPDLTPHAASASFTLLAYTVAMGVLEMYFEHVVLKIFFSLTFLWFCISMGVVFYGLGEEALDDDRHQWLQVGKWEVFYKWVPDLGRHVRSHYRKDFKDMTRLVFLCVFFVLNIGICICIFLPLEFAHVLLGIFLGNFVVYLLFYLAMKLAAGERPTASCWVFLGLKTIFCVWALIYFKDEVTSKSLGHTDSKHLNKDCELLNFFDAHDIWHFLSSLGLFFSLMFLLTLDDDISNKSRDSIQAF